MKLANLKTSYNSIPCGSKLVVGAKTKTLGVDLYKCYTSIKQDSKSYAGEFPGNVLQFTKF